MKLEWDERKRQQNLEKHGIDFAILGPMFRGKVLEEDDRRRDYGERRVKAVGILDAATITVVYTQRGERRRIISARRARADEREQYRIKATQPEK